MECHPEEYYHRKYKTKGNDARLGIGGRKFFTGIGSLLVTGCLLASLDMAECGTGEVVPERNVVERRDEPRLVGEVRIARRL